MSTRNAKPEDTKPQTKPKPVTSAREQSVVLGGNENGKGPKKVQVDPSQL